MLCLISIEHGYHGTYLLRADYPDGETDSILVQTDWDYPGIATNFGWEPCPECRDTDGTVDCEHRTASEMIADAAAFLDDITGECRTVPDPGYFRQR